MAARIERSLTAAAVLPEWDVREEHSVPVDAAPERALAAALEVTAAEAPLLRLLFRLRGLPVSARPVWEELLAVGFMEVAPGLAVGVGRPWRVGGGMRRPEDFGAFAEPGWAKMAMDFRVEAALLVTETRVRCTDTWARRRFRAYWLVIRPFSGLVRRSWLQAAKRRAESPQPAREHEFRGPRAL
jgi:hypothetical protein